MVQTEPSGEENFCLQIITDVELLNTALTHSSFVRGDNRIYPNNERMEFLGDAVLELCASEYLYLNYPKMNEGMMTRTRARTVCETALNIVAKELELGKYLLLISVLSIVMIEATAPSSVFKTALPTKPSQTITS